MKIRLDIALKGPLKDDDILVYREGVLVNVRKEQYFSEMNKQYHDLKKEHELLKSDIEKFKEGVNAKLEQYHNILQTLVKEN